jgi:O-antigen ligase
MFRPTRITHPRRPLTSPGVLASPAATATAGVTGTIVLTWYVANHGVSSKLLLGLVGLALFVGLVASFMAVPWIAIPLTIPLFVAIPTLKVFVASVVGGVKDAVSLAAIVAAALTIVLRRSRGRPTGLDGTSAVLILALFVLYALNAGGLVTGETGHGTAWAQGIRLFFEPLLLFVVGLVLPGPARTFPRAMTSLVATAVGVAAYGLLQQRLGVQRLMSLGYTYGEEVRQISGRLRSFGTLGEPFTYASFLLLAVAVVLLRGRLTERKVATLGLLAAGLLVSYVRTAALIALALAAVALARGRHTRLAVGALAIATVAACIAFAASADQPSSRTLALNSTTYVTLNGRTKLWRQQLGPPGDWILGRGVGAVGTAAQRAKESLTGKQELNTRFSVTVIDSGYLGVIADVGILGLGLMLALLARFVVLARAGTKAGHDGGWVAVGIVILMAIDALSRESFTAFPTAYLGTLLVGLAIAASRERAEA